VYSDWAVLGRGFSAAGAAVCRMKRQQLPA
jgi:hypothetical protein